MTWDVVGLLLKDHGIYMLIICALGWAYWQERKEALEKAKTDKEDNKAMITALVEVRDALRLFKEKIDSKFTRR